MRNSLFIVLLLVIASCSNSKQKQTTSTNTITVSVLPQKYIVEQIAGDFLTVNVMVPPGASPSDYEPTPKQMVALSNSALYFFVGHLGFEEAWLNRLKKNAPNTKFESWSDNLDFEETSEEMHDHSENDGHHHHHKVDPHIWMSPKLVKQIVAETSNKLQLAYPDKKTVFEKNAVKFITQIDSLDRAFEHSFAASKNKSFMIFHPALGYLAKDYGLEQHAIEFEGKSPSTAHLQKMIDLVRSEKISTIFIQSQFETEKAKSVAHETNTQVVAINPLEENWLQMQNDIKSKLIQALSEN